MTNDETPMEHKRILENVNMMDELIAFMEIYFGRQHAMKVLAKEINYLGLEMDDLKIEDERERLIKGLMLHVFQTLFSIKKNIMIKSRLYTVLKVKPDFFV